jgi:hypothetical protein
MWTIFSNLCCVFYFCNIFYAFQNKMYISEINVFFCVLNKFISNDEFVLIHWIEKFNVRSNSTFKAWFWRCSWSHLWMIWRRKWIWSSRCWHYDHIYGCCNVLLNDLWHHFTNHRLNHFLNVLIRTILLLLSRHFDFAWRKENYKIWWFSIIRENLWMTIFQFLQFDFRNFVSNSFQMWNIFRQYCTTLNWKIWEFSWIRETINWWFC